MLGDDQYFIELTSKAGRFELVNRFVWDNRTKALDDEGNSRYTDNRFCVVNGFVSLHFDAISLTLLGKIARMSGADIDKSSVSNGFYDEPRHVPIRGQRGVILLHDLESGAVYKKVG